jgi:hypothetical protein
MIESYADVSLGEIRREDMKTVLRVHRYNEGTKFHHPQMKLQHWVDSDFKINILQMSKGDNSIKKSTSKKYSCIQSYVY